MGSSSCARSNTGLNQRITLSTPYISSLPYLQMLGNRRRNSIARPDVLIIYILTVFPIFFFFFFLNTYINTINVSSRWGCGSLGCHVRYLDYRVLFGLKFHIQISKRLPWISKSLCTCVIVSPKSRGETSVNERNLFSANCLTL